MTAEGTVTRITDDTHAVVETARKSACAECHRDKGSGCRGCDFFIGADRIETTVINSIGAKVGDRVIVESSSGQVILAAAIVFVLPLVAAACAYAVTYFIPGCREYAPLYSLGGLAAGIIGVVLYGRFRRHGETIRIVKIIDKDTL